MGVKQYPLARQPRILVVEDQRAHALHAAGHLRNAGFGVEIAQSLAEGVRQAEISRSATGERYPLLILIDLHLPIPHSYPLSGDAAMTEGAALAVYLRRKLSIRTLLAAYTSDPSVESYQEALLAGCQMVLPKPFTGFHARLLRSVVEQPTPYPAASYEPANGGTLLTVREHRSGILSGLQRVLERAAARIVGYAAGRETEATAAAPAPTTEPRMRWDHDAVRGLLLNYPDLLDSRPAAARWMVEQGGLEQVLLRLRAGCGRFPQAQQQILEQILNNPVASDWDRMAAQVGLAKSAFYNHRQKLFNAIATEMNSWLPRQPDSEGG